MASLTFAYPFLIYGALAALLLGSLYSFFSSSRTFIRYQLANLLYDNNKQYKGLGTLIPTLLRFFILFLLTLLIGRPLWIENFKSVKGEGVDIVFAIDVSGSMQLFDDLKDQRSRLQVAIEESIRLVEKRKNDQIGVVIFATDALSLVPLTLDTTLLKNSIASLTNPIIDHNATFLSTGLMTAINRLKRSTAKSKAVILLTDGLPTGETDITPDMAIEAAKLYNIKVYTIAIGNDKGAYAKEHGRIFPVGSEGSVDKVLLARIAGETGGASFEAKKPADMRKIYNTIDSLERSEYETSFFATYQEACMPFMYLLLFLFLLEWIASYGIWRRLI